MECASSLAQDNQGVKWYNALGYSSHEAHLKWRSSLGGRNFIGIQNVAPPYLAIRKWYPLSPTEPPDSACPLNASPRAECAPPAAAPQRTGRTAGSVPDLLDLLIDLNAVAIMASLETTNPRKPRASLEVVEKDHLIKLADCISSSPAISGCPDASGWKTNVSICVNLNWIASTGKIDSDALYSSIFNGNNHGFQWRFFFNQSIVMLWWFNLLNFGYIRPPAGERFRLRKTAEPNWRSWGHRHSVHPAQVLVVTAVNPEGESTVEKIASGKLTVCSWKLP